MSIKLGKIEVQEYTVISGYDVNVDRVAQIFNRELKVINKDIFDGCLNPPYQIADLQFYNYLDLEELYVPDSITSIGNGAFTFPSNIRPIDDTPTGYSYNSGSLHKLDLNNVIHIGQNAFYGAIWGDEDVEIEIPYKVYRIGATAFSYNGINKLTINRDAGLSVDDQNILNIEGGAFMYNKDLTYLIIHNPVSLETGVRDTVSFKNQVFKGCESLITFITDPGIEFDGSNIFEGCSNLSTINFWGTMAEWEATSKQSNWAEGSSIEEIICSDGTVTL